MDVQEKKLVIGGTIYIYWEVILAGDKFTITAFNNGSLYMYFSKCYDPIDAVIRPVLKDVNADSIHGLCQMTKNLLQQSSDMYNDSSRVFTAYILLHDGTDDSEIHAIFSKGRTKVDEIGPTVVGGIRFNKYEITIKSK